MTSQPQLPDTLRVLGALSVQGSGVLRSCDKSWRRGQSSPWEAVRVRAAATQPSQGPFRDGARLQHGAIGELISAFNIPKEIAATRPWEGVLAILPMRTFSSRTALWRPRADLTSMKMTKKCYGPSQLSGFSSDAERWEALSQRDRAADGVFLYSLRTTGICCRPYL